MGKKKKQGSSAGASVATSISSVEQQQRLWDAAQAASGRGPGKTSDVCGEEELFSVRRIRFLGQQVPILLQNRNGPCPLLAVANALLLKGRLELGLGESSLSSSQLLERLSESLLRSERQDANAQTALDELLALLPRLLDGMLLNCRFAACDAFEYTRELALFDQLGVKLYHAWVAPPEVVEVAASWNALAETLAICSELRSELESGKRSPTAQDSDRLASGLWLEQWLEESTAQATMLGLQQLASAIGKQDVCVLFRNNHFCTLYKPREDLLCSLLTDISFQEVDNAIWECVELHSGTGGLLGPDFRSALEKGSASSGQADLQETDGSGSFSATQEESITAVQALGFDRDQAIAALLSVGWSGPEDAIDALLDDGKLAADSAKSSSGGSRTRPLQEEHICASCRKKFGTQNALMNHRSSKGH